MANGTPASAPASQPPLIAALCADAASVDASDTAPPEPAATAAGLDALTASLDALDPGAVAAGAWDERLRALVAGWAEAERGREAASDASEAASAAFRDAWAEAFGEPRRAEAAALATPPDSREERRATVVWEMSRLLRSQGSRLSQTFGPTGGQREYMRLRQRALAEFADTTASGRLDEPSWREEPAGLTAAIREASTQPDDVGPRAARRRREALEAEIAALDGEASERLHALLDAARERASALDDLDGRRERLAASARSMWLRVGAGLVERGALAEASDVFGLDPSALVETLEHGEVAAVAR